MTDYFDDYFFTSNVSDHTCPGFGSFECKPPNACARDPNTGRRYCCDFKDVCWTVTEKCASDGSTIDCGTGSTTWCCVDDREKCTATKGQINICWSTHHDILNNITNKVLNGTYSSLSSAHPSATTWAFDPILIIAQTDPAVTQSATPSASASSSAIITDVGTSAAVVPTTTSASDGDHAATINGAAIAGIVVGVVAGVALVGLGLFFLGRRSRQKKAAASAAAAATDAGAGAGAGTDAYTPVPNPGGGVGGMDDKLRYAGAQNFGADNRYYDNSSTSPPQPAWSSPTPASELHGDFLIPQELQGSPGPGHSELSATSPAVTTSFGAFSGATSTAGGDQSQQPQQQPSAHQ